MRFILIASLALLAASGAYAADDHQALEQVMRQRLMLKPNDLDARFDLARSLAWQARYPEARAEYQRLLKVRPQNADYLLGLAQVHLWRGAVAESLPLLRQARRLAPDYADVWRVEIQALLALPDAESLGQAGRLREAARERFPHASWTFAQLDGGATTPDVTVARKLPTEARIASAVGDGNSPSSAPVQLAAAEVLAAPVAPAVLGDRYAWEAGVSDESLSGGLPNWRSRYVFGQMKLADRQAIYAGWRETERYSLTDREMHVGGVLSLSTAVQLQMEAGVSASHQVLPERYGSVQFQWQPAPAWSLFTGYRRSFYATGLSKVAQLGVDRSIGNERFGYTLYSGGPDGSGLAPSHRVQWTHDYGERDSFGISLTRGRETESAGSRGFITSEVSGVTLIGRHSLVPGWAIAWEIGSQRQGDLYFRKGGRLGLRHSF